jgi:hypothetical protein
MVARQSQVKYEILAGKSGLLADDNERAERKARKEGTIIRSGLAEVGKEASNEDARLNYFGWLLGRLSLQMQMLGMDGSATKVFIRCDYSGG